MQRLVTEALCNLHVRKMRDGLEHSSGYAVQKRRFTYPLTLGAVSGKYSNATLQIRFRIDQLLLG